MLPNQAMILVKARDMSTEKSYLHHKAIGLLPVITASPTNVSLQPAAKIKLKN